MLALTSPCRTIYHDLPAGPKIAFLSLFTFLVYLVELPLIVVSAFVLVVLMYLVNGTRMVLAAIRSLRPLAYFIAVIVIWQTIAGNPVQGMLTSLKLLTTVSLANLVTMTTRLDDMLLTIGRMANSVGISKDRSRALAMSVALVVRFVPVMTGKGKMLADAWKCRSLRRPGWRIIPPLACLAIDDANHVALAIRARGGIGPHMSSPGNNTSKDQHSPR